MKWKCTGCGQICVSAENPTAGFPKWGDGHVCVFAPDKEQKRWVEIIDIHDDSIVWKKDSQIISISLSDDGHWVLYQQPNGNPMGEQGFKDRNDAIEFAKHRYGIIVEEE